MIHLIGTMHADFQGEERLRKYLAHLRPSVIGLEDTPEHFEQSQRIVNHLSTPEGFEAALENFKRLFPEGNPETLSFLVSAMEYDVKAVNSYSWPETPCIVHGDSPEELGKLDFGAMTKDPESDLMKEVRRLVVLSPKDAREFIEREYVSSEDGIDSAEELAIHKARDRYAAGILRAQTGNIVYVCGMDHIYGDYHPNLHDLLADLNPQRISLNEADKL